MSKESKILVFFQFSCLAYLIFFTKFVSHGYLLIFQLFGFLLSFWAVLVMKIGKFNIQPELKENSRLVSNGPYRLIRNPMYTGLIIFFGSVIFNSVNILNIIVLLLLIVILLLKIRLEERILENHFGDIYLDYKQKTKRLIPYIL